jgi:hypothetical protein
VEQQEHLVLQVHQVQVLQMELAVQVVQVEYLVKQELLEFQEPQVLRE